MSSSSSSNHYNRKKLSLANGGRTRFSPSGDLSSRSINSNSNSVMLHNLVKLNQLVDTLKSLKRLISHYFDQISKQGESNLAGDVRRVYRRILLLYVKYRRRQNYEKRRMKQPIDESDDDDDNDTDNQYDETKNSSIGTTKKTVSSHSLSFTRAGFDADHESIEDFDEIALAATRDVANIQNHCVRLILNDHQMKLPVYGLPTRWDSEIPNQRKQTHTQTMTTTNSRVQVIKKSGTKSPNNLSSSITSLPIPPPSPLPTTITTTTATNDQELFLGSLARQLNDQTWQQLQTILANLNSQTTK